MVRDVANSQKETIYKILKDVIKNDPAAFEALFSWYMDSLGGMGEGYVYTQYARKFLIRFFNILSRLHILELNFIPLQTWIRALKREDLAELSKHLFEILEKFKPLYSNDEWYIKYNGDVYSEVYIGFENLGYCFLKWGHRATSCAKLKGVIEAYSERYGDTFIITCLKQAIQESFGTDAYEMVQDIFVFDKLYKQWHKYTYLESNVAREWYLKFGGVSCEVVYTPEGEVIEY